MSDLGATIRDGWNNYIGVWQSAAGQGNAVFAPVGGGIPSKVKGKVAGINNFNGGSNRGSHSSTLAVGKKLTPMSKIIRR